MDRRNPEPNFSLSLPEYNSHRRRMPPWFLLLSLAFAASAQPIITSSPSGPYHVEGARILDAKGREYLIRGTTLPLVTHLNGDPPSGFGPFSATTLITLRQRMNMNAVRIPIDPREYAENPHYRSFVKELVQKANQFELLAILESASPIPAADFKSNPNLFFAVPNMAAATAIRSQGATQPIIVNCKSNSGAGSRPALRSAPASTTPPQPSPDCEGGDSRKGDINQADAPNIIYQISPSYQSLPETWQNTAPLLVTGLDPNLSTPECRAFPSDPAAASKLFEDLLTQFDNHSISWTISTMEPGRLIDNYSGYDWTKLDDGWTCGAPFSGAGIGMALLAHLWRGDVHGVFTVNQPAGGLVIARGANASAYGRILAERETSASVARLSNISIRVTDARGASRLAPLLWTGAGWSSTNLIIPDESAPGPAEVAVVRSDGSKTASQIIIADAAPGLWTAAADGRGAVIAKAYLRGEELPAWTCPNVCRTVPIPISPNAPTTIRLEGTGFRHAGAVSVIIDGIALPIESFGPMPSSSRDQVIVKLPATLTGRGETDVYLIADGRLSNVARINLGQVGQAVPPAIAKPQPYVNQTVHPTTAKAHVGQAVPPAIPTTKSELGRYLFYDKRMSINGTTSCASCHHQDLAFTDGRAQAEGATGQLHPRSAMSLVNLAYSTAFNWNDPTVHSLEQQALKPMRSTAPVELGLNEPAFIKLIASDEVYQPLFREAFPQEKNPYTISNVTRAIAAFERTITSANSPYDRFHRNGDQSAISDSAKRGEVLFFLDGGPSCFRCHAGASFSDSAFHNNGLGAAGKFKTPTLRNIALTAPYMHDGSMATLEQVVDHYATGGKQGHDPIMRGFTMTPQNRIDLVAFLKALTDENLLHDPRYSNPWPTSKQ